MAEMTERRTGEPAWEHFPHDADIGVRGRGATLGEALQNAALAMSATITDPAGVALAEAVRISCEAPDAETLLVDWLNAIVFEMATRGMVFGSYSVSLDGYRLAAEARGEKVDAGRHDPAVEVKGATFTALRVGREDDGSWLAQCVVDV